VLNASRRHGEEHRPSGEHDAWLSNGLIVDWALWQKEGGQYFALLREVLAQMSPASDEQLIPGELTTLADEGSRLIPTLKMPYGVDVPILTASAGMRRIVALTYLLISTWLEHVRATAAMGEAATTQVTFLIDEIEAHLHPRWQRTIVRSLLTVMDRLAQDSWRRVAATHSPREELRIRSKGAPQVQLIAATHSPLVLASVEPLFNARSDAWFDLELVKSGSSAASDARRVQLNQGTFVRRGDVSSWLRSEAFGLREARSLEAEEAMGAALAVLRQDAPSRPDIDDADRQLRATLGDTDRFWVRWSELRESGGQRRCGSSWPRSRQRSRPKYGSRGCAPSPRWSARNLRCITRPPRGGSHEDRPPERRFRTPMLITAVTPAV
jgi:hypothetical protein